MNDTNNCNDYEFFFWTKQFNFRSAVINVCPVLVLSVLLLSAHLQ